MQNRLRLNWTLSTREERNQFVISYLETCPFKYTLTEKELITLSDYILWGENSDGKNGRQEGLQLETSSKTWDAQKIESLDALIESPSFTEASIRSPLNPPTLYARDVFSREKAEKNAPPFILKALKSLWRTIDELDLIITEFELLNNRREKPIRQELLDRFNESDILILKTRAASIDQLTYLKMKHQLVQLRREQYTLRDSYNPQVPMQPTEEPKIFNSPTFITEINVFPFGTIHNSKFFQKIFRLDRFPIPSDFSSEELNRLSFLLWNDPAPNKFLFDFQNVDHLTEAFNLWEELNDEIEDPESNLKEFVDTLKIYWKLSNLEPFLEEILELKIQKFTNQRIADIINKKYKKNYKPNYISTLYYKKCLGEIAQTAADHREVLENLFFPENFKKCKDCGRVLLLNEKNFVKRKRSNDGFSPRCKKCEKIIRDRSKN